MRIRPAILFAVASALIPRGPTGAAQAGELEDIQTALRNQGAAWVAGETSLSRLTPQQRKARFSALSPALKSRARVLSLPAPQAALPAAWDWRQINGHSYVTPVREQGSCASCWAFSTTGALESYVLRTQDRPDQNLDLSEEILVACDTGDLGCDGGFLDAASDFMKATGTAPEAADPYISVDGTTGQCSDAAPGWQRGAYRIGDWATIGASTAAIKSALIAYGPLVAGFTIYADFLYYTSGVYSHVSGLVEGGHAVVIIGYDDAEQCFLAKNSFGPGWGEGGFFKIAYDDGCAFKDSVIAFSSANVTTLNLEIATPADQAPAFGSVSVSGTAGVTTSSVVVTSVEVRVDDGAWSRATGTTDWSYALDGDSLSRGSHTLSARAMDSTGNSASAAVTITHSAPGAPALTATAVSSTAIRWSWTPADQAASALGLFYSSGTLRESLSPSASFFLETGLSTNTAYSRYVAAQNTEGQTASSTVTVVTPGAQSCIVGTASATITGAAGAALEIPAGLLGAATSWLISESPTTHPLTGQALALIAAAQAGTPAGSGGSAASLTEFIVAVDGQRSAGTLNEPVRVSVPYPDANDDGIVDGTDPPVLASSLKLYVLNENTALWGLVPNSSVDLVHHLVTGPISHLSIFTALGTAGSAAADLSHVLVYPIPYRPTGGDPNRGKPYSAGDPTSGIIFDHLPNAVTIDILTITGRRVARLSTTASSGKVRWNAQNDSGQDAASGGYVAVLSSPGCGTITRKLIIVR